MLPCVRPRVKGASFFTLAALSESNHTNLISVVCPKELLWLPACSEALVPLFAPEKSSDVLERSLNRPFPFFPSNLIYHTLLLSVTAHQRPAFGFITSQQVRQMAAINYQEPLLQCLSLTLAL